MAYKLKSKVKPLKIRSSSVYIVYAETTVSNKHKSIKKLDRNFLSLTGKMIFSYDIGSFFRGLPFGSLAGSILKMNRISKEDFLFVAKIFYEDLKNFHDDKKLRSFKILKDNKTMTFCTDIRQANWITINFFEDSKYKNKEYKDFTENELKKINDINKEIFKNMQEEMKVARE